MIGSMDNGWGASGRLVGLAFAVKVTPFFARHGGAISLMLGALQVEAITVGRNLYALMTLGVSVQDWTAQALCGRQEVDMREGLMGIMTFWVGFPLSIFTATYPFDRRTLILTGRD